MKKIRITIYILILICMTMISCEDTRLTGIVDDKIYILNSGNQVFDLNRVEAKDFEMVVYKAGVGKTSAKVKVIVDLEVLEKHNAESDKKYELLPEACYSLLNLDAVVFKDKESDIIPITLDGGAIYILQGRLVTNYALPIRIEPISGAGIDAEQSTVLIIPKIN